MTLLGMAATMKAADPDSLYAQKMLKIGTMAPNIVIDSTSNFSLQSLRGRYVVLHFWASWCPDCRKDMPIMNHLYNKYASDSVVFVHVSYDTNRETWQQYIKESEMQGIQVAELKKWKKETLTDRAFHIDWIPSMYVLNPEGRVLLGTVSVEKLRNRLSMLDYSKVRISGRDKARKPSFPGGMLGLKKFLSQNVKYPRVAANYGIEAVTTMEFVVEKDGTITGVRVADNQITRADQLPFRKLTGDQQRDLLDRCLSLFADESLRVVSVMPHWEPGKQFGMPVKVKYQMPIVFRISYTDDR